MQDTDERGTPESIFLPLDYTFNFTLDPCAMRNRPLKRDIIEYFVEDDGLTKDWFGHRVFVNPPYSRGRIGDWVLKVVEEASRGVFICVLVRQDCSTVWYQVLSRMAWHVEDIPYRVGFTGSKGGKPFWSSCVMLLGGPFPFKRPKGVEYITGRLGEAQRARVSSLFNKRETRY